MFYKSFLLAVTVVLIAAGNAIAADVSPVNNIDDVVQDPSIHQSINPSIHQSINPSIHQSINPSIHQSINRV